MGNACTGTDNADQETYYRAFQQNHPNSNVVSNIKDKHKPPAVNVDQYETSAAASYPHAYREIHESLMQDCVHRLSVPPQPQSPNMMEDATTPVQKDTRSPNSTADEDTDAATKAIMNGPDMDALIDTLPRDFTLNKLEKLVRNSKQTVAAASKDAMIRASLASTQSTNKRPGYLPMTRQSHFSQPLPQLALMPQSGILMPVNFTQGYQPVVMLPQQRQVSFGSQFMMFPSPMASLPPMSSPMATASMTSVPMATPSMMSPPMTTPSMMFPQIGRPSMMSPQMTTPSMMSPPMATTSMMSPMMVQPMVAPSMMAAYPYCGNRSW